MTDLREQADEKAALLRLAEHLTSECITPGVGRCSLVAAPGVPDHDEAWPEDRGRCPGLMAAIRWEDGFADEVCERHAAEAEKRGAVVVRPRRHDGTVEHPTRPGKEQPDG